MSSSVLSHVDVQQRRLAEFRSLLPDIHRPDKFARIVQLLGELRKNHLLIDREVIALNSGPVVIDASPALASVPLVDQTRATGGSGARDSQHALSACADILRKERVTKEPLMLNERVYEDDLAFSLSMPFPDGIRSTGEFDDGERSGVGSALLVVGNVCTVALAFTHPKIIRRVAVFSLAEKAEPFGHSKHAVFERLSSLALAAIGLAPRFTEDFLPWLAMYQTLFDRPCRRCERMLLYDTSSAALLPPLVRTALGEPYHLACAAQLGIAEVNIPPPTEG